MWGSMESPVLASPYFLSACCVEACRRNYRCKFVDYSDLLDELIVLNRQEDLNKYRKRIRYYARIQLLFIDDFAISRYSEEGIQDPCTIS